MVLRVQNLKKSYHDKRGAKQALRGVSFAIEEGEIFGLLGPNGAGKSTTINILIGLLSEDTGTIEIFGKEFHAHNTWIRRQMNVSTAYAQLPLRLSVEENLRVFGYLYSIPKREQRIRELMERFDILHLRDVKIAQLSSGQKALVNLCKALLNEPRLLLLDEPTSSLDPENSLKTRETLLALQKEKKMTILWTSHDMPEVEEVCDRIAFLIRGAIEVTDTPEHLVRLVETQEVVVTFPSVGIAEACCQLVWPKGTTCLASGGRVVTFRLPHKTGAVRQLLKAFHERRLAFLDIHTARPALEEVFLTLAQRQRAAQTRV